MADSQPAVREVSASFCPHCVPTLSEGLPCWFTWRRPHLLPQVCVSTRPMQMQPLQRLPAAFADEADAETDRSTGDAISC